MTYQRGTDLLNCPRDCYNFRYDTYPMGAELSCIAKPNGTCHREQAEVVKAKRSAEICAACFYDQTNHRCVECHRPLVRRTNG